MSYNVRNTKELLDKTEYILREVRARFKNPCLLWSTGKDSTALVHIVKNLFYDIPWDVVHIDTGLLFPEIYEFRTRLTKEWNIPLKIARKDTIYVPGSCNEEEIFKCCTNRKTLALKEIFQEEHYDAALLAIRWDELGIRSKEHYFSPRTHEWEWKVVRKKTKEEIKEGDSPFVPLTEPEMWQLYQTEFGKDCEHVRVHATLHWSEIDIWEYIDRKSVV